LYISVYTDAALMRFVGEPMTDDQAARAFAGFLRSNSAGDLTRACCWVIESANGARAGEGAVGLLALMPHEGRAEIGVMVRASWQGCKVAQETIGFLSGHLFAHGVWSSTFSRHVRENEAGAGVMRRLGFREMTEVPGGARFRGWEMNHREWSQRFDVQLQETT
jgi:RimJ/RimL family protein N-acetyltransferase